jgi:dCMP deaminase
MKRSLLIYVPVLHNGYIQLLDKYKDKVKTVYVLGNDFVSGEYKEIRLVSPNVIVKMIRSLDMSFAVRLITKKNINILKNKNLVVLNDPISISFLKSHLPKGKFEQESVYLRWHEDNVQSPNSPHYDSETNLPFDINMMRKAEMAGQSSTDWWRRVGCVVVKERKVIQTSFNSHFPQNDTQYIDGDPRDFIKAGQLGFLASSAHAEQMAIALAARNGKSLKGADMYVSTYPCPTCAKLMATSGIKKCFFRGGNSYLDVEKVFKSTGLKAILVK